MIIDTIRYPIRRLASIIGGEFHSIFHRGFNSFYEANRESRSYSEATRGILIAKDALKRAPIDLKQGYKFQFNPQTVSDSKNTRYEVRGYAGLNYSDYIWSGGGERTLSFQLFLDNTPQSKTAFFNPEVEANVISQHYKGSSSTESKGKIRDFSYEGNAYSNTRVHERGILPEVDLIRSFLYPKKLEGTETPAFSEGGVIDNTQFRPPQIAVLCLGPIYLEGVLMEATVEYTLFDKDLTPLRANMGITFSAFEFVEAGTDKVLNT